ncbi:MAG: GNAT family N-acetyltransferase [Ruminococcaceae bacterium]|nr:GNAT family N-acetyltransferase [Oscillospiraceae bacterium]
MTLRTQRLILRPWREDDAQALFEYASDPLVGPAAGWAAHKSVEESRSIISEVLSAEGTFAVCIAENGDAPVGSIGWFSRSRTGGEPELGYWIGRPFWGRGYIPEAVDCLLTHLFTKTDCERVWCSHFIENEKSRRVIQKSGFRPEFLRECEWPAIGGRLLEQFYSLRKSEFFAKRGLT